MRIIKTLLIASIAALAMALAAVAAERAPQQEMFPELGTVQVKKMMDDRVNFVLVDARPTAEYAQGHIKGAQNIPPEKYRYIGGILPQNKSIPVVFYCRGYG